MNRYITHIIVLALTVLGLQACGGKQETAEGKLSTAKKFSPINTIEQNFNDTDANPFLEADGEKWESGSINDFGFPEPTSI